MKKGFVFIAAAIFTLSFSCCKKKDSGPPANTANVLFFNGCAVVNTLSATAGGSNVAGAENISFLGGTGYKYVTAGSNVNIGFNVPGINSTLANGSVSLANAAHYSAFAGGLSTGARFLLTTDDLTAPSSGKAKIRLVNLCTDTLHFTFNIDNAPKNTGVGAMTVTSFSEVANGNVRLIVQDPTQLSSIVTLDQPLNAGKIYTVVLTGTLIGTGTGALKMTVVTNN